MDSQVIICPICRSSQFEKLGASLHKCSACGAVYEHNSSLADDIRHSIMQGNLELNKFQNFERAIEYYKSAIDQDSTCAEAYWGLFLADYGVNYVKDEKSEANKPTVHRLGKDSALLNQWYLKCLEHADSDSKMSYQSKAKLIEQIRSKYYELSIKEESYDIFICYKKTKIGGTDDEFTVDSRRASEIYHDLTNRGYKVFFAEQTLNHKAGEEYEPIIYNALNTARLMLVVLSDEKHADTPWVRNEWQRFINLAKLDNDKKLFIILDGVSPSTLPANLKKIQALDYTSYSFKENLFDNIAKVSFCVKGGIKREVVKKIDVKFNKTVELKENSIKRDFRTATGSVVANAERAYQMAESARKGGNLEGAARKYREVISLDHNYHKAYWGLMLAEYAIGDIPNTNEVVKFASNPLLDDTLSHCTASNAKYYLDTLLNVFDKCNNIDAGYLALYNKYLEWADDNGDMYIAQLLADKIMNGKIKKAYMDKAIDSALMILAKNDADRHISIMDTMATYAMNANKAKVAGKLYDRILALNEWDTNALWGKHLCAVGVNSSSNYMKGQLSSDSQYELTNKLLSVSQESNTYSYIVTMSSGLVQYAINGNATYAKEQFDKIVRVAPDALYKQLYPIMLEFAESLISIGETQSALIYVEDALARNNQDARAHWLMYLIKNCYKNIFDVLLSDNDPINDDHFNDASNCASTKIASSLNKLVELYYDVHKSNDIRAVLLSGQRILQDYKRGKRLVGDKAKLASWLEDNSTGIAGLQHITQLVSKCKLIKLQNEIEVKQVEKEKKEKSNADAEVTKRKKIAISFALQIIAVIIGIPSTHAGFIPSSIVMSILGLELFFLVAWGIALFSGNEDMPNWVASAFFILSIILLIASIAMSVWYNIDVSYYGYY